MVVLMKRVAVGRTAGGVEQAGVDVKTLNPEPKTNLNHANLKPPNLWAVVSRICSFHSGISLKSHSNQSFTFRCRSCPQADFVPVVARSLAE